MNALPASYFDGRVAAPTPVALRVEDGLLVVEAPGDSSLRLRHALADVQVSERFETTPRLVALPDGGTLEVPDPDGSFELQLRAAGARPGLVLRLQAFWPGSLACLVALVLLLVLLYVDGLPAAARWAAFALPADLEQRLGEKLLDSLDGKLLLPSYLPPEQQARIADRLAAAAASSYPGLQYRLEFRMGPGINAFALPGGTIVLLDGLVDFCGDDEDAVLGVLGHELGHVAGKHVTRRLFESASIGVISAQLWGDLSGAASSSVAVFGMLACSRDFEREADDFAIAFLAAQGLPPDALDRFFGKLDAEYGADARSIPEFISTHPSTDERRARLAEAAR